jgi:glycosyltransferase involved in cell wall biosynthesis
MGKVPRAQFLWALKVSAAHVYLTYPFVLSWSMLEAMACGALVIASDTASVREVIQDGENGRLVGFFDAPGIAELTLDALSAPQAQQAMRERARADVQRYDYEAGLAGYDQLIGG